MANERSLRRALVEDSWQARLMVKANLAATRKELSPISSTTSLAGEWEQHGRFDSAGTHARGRPKNKTYPSASCTSNPRKSSVVSVSGSKNSTLRDENSSANASGSAT